MDNSSTPGYCCLSTMGTTNGEILGFDGLNYDPERVAIVKSIVKARYDSLLAGNKIADNIKVFVKQEPHKLAKLEQNKERLISAVSLVDTFVDRIIWGWLARACLSNVARTPCLVGWSPVRGDWRPFSELYANKPVLCLDKSSWDWTVRGWMVEAFNEFVKNLCVNAPPFIYQLMDARMELLFRDAVFQFEDGTVVQQCTHGIMKSGCFLTILMNSVCQSLIHYIANIRLGLPPAQNEPRVIGDDTVQLGFPHVREYVEKIEQLGPVVKGAKIRHHVEFAGFAFADGVCYPAYWQKHLFNMAHSPNLVETLLSYQYLYVHEPVMYAFITRVAAEIGPHAILPRLVALDIMDNPR
uniref:RNA-directed RNA polymerase C-terminal domain-containing protein n=1 Tax=Blue fish point virus TaxID=2485865 RepID=A0A3G3BTD6_9VIRU|nr:hypothetical protein [Blue fish point virus]